MPCKVFGVPVLAPCSFVGMWAIQTYPDQIPEPIATSPGSVFVKTGTETMEKETAKGMGKEARHRAHH